MAPSDGVTNFVKKYQALQARRGQFEELQKQEDTLIEVSQSYPPACFSYSAFYLPLYSYPAFLSGLRDLQACPECKL